VRAAQTIAEPGNVSGKASGQLEGEAEGHCGSGSRARSLLDVHGHATVAITLDTYSHAIPAMHEEAAALIAGLVFAKEVARRPRA
jgi:hypothetical protein